jgi:hypothetical protein
MKKLFILLVLIVFSTPVISIEYDSSSKFNPERQMQYSFEKQDRICREIAYNFRMDPKFSAYIKNSCTLYNDDRNGSIRNLFSSTKRQNGEDSYRVQAAKYAIAKDNAQIEYYRQLTNQYCQNREYRLSVKDPQACNRFDSIINKYNNEELINDSSDEED